MGSEMCIRDSNHSDQKISAFRQCQARLRQLLPVSRRRIAASVLLALSSSLGVLLLVILLRSSTSTTRVAAYALRSTHQKLSHRAVCLQILQQLMTKHDGGASLASIQALAASAASAQVAQTRASGHYIEYKASKGLGHRLTRAAAAYHCEFRLFTFDGSCSQNHLLTNHSFSVL